MSLRSRLWSKVDSTGAPDDCWPWTAFRTKRGYGRIKVGGRATFAHRVALGLTIAEPFDGALALHHCDNPPCCNPKHLYWGTPQQNAQDREDRGRGRERRGRASPNASDLQDADVIAIRSLYAAGGTTHKAIAGIFGIGRRTVQDIVLGRRWAHVQGEAR